MAAEITGASIDLDLEPYLDRLQQTIDALARPVEPSPVAPVASAGPGVEALGPGLDQLTRSLASIGASIEAAAANRPAPSAGGSQVQVVQTLRPGVYQLMDELAGNVESNLMELLRDISRWIKRTEVDPDARLKSLFDETLSGLDRFKDLVEALRRIDTQGLVPEVDADAGEG